jgi:hypothetical protein
VGHALHLPGKDIYVVGSERAPSDIRGGTGSTTILTVTVTHLDRSAWQTVTDPTTQTSAFDATILMPDARLETFLLAPTNFPFGEDQVSSTILVVLTLCISEVA